MTYLSSLLTREAKLLGSLSNNISAIKAQGPTGDAFRHRTENPSHFFEPYFPSFEHLGQLLAETVFLTYMFSCLHLVVPYF
jgi:hypothetical protein